MAQMTNGLSCCWFYFLCLTPGRKTKHPEILRSEKLRAKKFCLFINVQIYDQATDCYRLRPFVRSSLPFSLPSSLVFNNYPYINHKFTLSLFCLNIIS